MEMVAHARKTPPSSHDAKVFMDRPSAVLICSHRSSSMAIRAGVFLLDDTVIIALVLKPEQFKINCRLKSLGDPRIVERVGSKDHSCASQSG